MNKLVFVSEILSEKDNSRERIAKLAIINSILKDNLFGSFTIIVNMANTDRSKCTGKYIAEQLCVLSTSRILADDLEFVNIDSYPKALKYFKRMFEGSTNKAIVAVTSQHLIDDIFDNRNNPEVKQYENVFDIIYIR